MSGNAGPPSRFCILHSDVMPNRPLSDLKSDDVSTSHQMWQLLPPYLTILQRHVCHYLYYFLSCLFLHVLFPFLFFAWRVVSPALHNTSMFSFSVLITYRSSTFPNPYICTLFTLGSSQSLYQYPILILPPVSPFRNHLSLTSPCSIMVSLSSPQYVLPSLLLHLACSNLSAVHHSQLSCIYSLTQHTCLSDWLWVL